MTATFPVLQVLADKTRLHGHSDPRRAQVLFFQDSETEQYKAFSHDLGKKKKTRPFVYCLPQGEEEVLANCFLQETAPGLVCPPSVAAAGPAAALQHQHGAVGKHLADMAPSWEKGTAVTCQCPQAQRSSPLK